MMNLQLFSGRGSSGGNSPSSKINSKGGNFSVTGAGTQAELNSKLKNLGLVLDSAYQRASNGEEVVMYQMENGKIKERFVGTYNKYKDGGREIVNIHSQPLVQEIHIGDRVWRVNPDGTQTEITKNTTKKK